MTVHTIQNTDKVYPCIQCGSKSANIVRESTDPRLKCNACGMMYDASASQAAEKAGAIPDGPPEIVDAVVISDYSTELQKADRGGVHAPAVQEISGGWAIPRTPVYVFLSKDRQRFQFSGAKAVKSVALKWEYEGVKYDLFELSPKKIQTKIDIQ